VKPEGRRFDGAFLVALFVVAFVPRLAVALGWAGEAVWDGHYYDFGAQRIAAGHGYSDDVMIAGRSVWHPWCHYPVGYSAFLGFFYWLFGAGARTAAFVNAAIGASLAVLTWLVAREGLSEKRARLAGGIVALHPGMILYAGLVMSEPLAATTTLLAFWIAVAGERSTKRLAAACVVLGLSALVRPQALLCAPFLGALTAPPLLPASWLTARPWMRQIAQWKAGALLACAVCLVPILPWTARNCAVMDGCALVSTNAGWNLAIGAFPRATGRFETLRSSDGCREVTGQVQQDRCWRAYGIEQIREHPGHWLGLVPAKLGFTFDHESFPVGYLREARPEAWPDAKANAVREGLSTAHRVLLVLAALGCIAFAPRGRGAAAQGALLGAALLLLWLAVTTGAPIFWPLAVFASVAPFVPLPGHAAWPPALLLGVSLLLTSAVTHAVFFGEDRYHMVVVPVLAMLAASALRKPAGHLADGLVGRAQVGKSA
jgi:4-amino-4-deoxy-L-arabinose transferase-like glycosyltransferase